MDKNTTYKEGTLIDLAKASLVEMRVAMFPGKYIQGRSSLTLCGEVLKSMGKSVLISGGKKSLQESMPKIEPSLGKNNIDFNVYEFNGKCTESEINAIANHAIENNVDFIMGVGGGKSLDAAKAAASQLGLSIVLAPTVASTDAPTSTIAVIYNEDCSFSHYLRFTKNPDLIIVDSEVIAKAPSRYFVAGIGGALAVSYEAEASSKAGAYNMVGGLAFNSVIKWAILCRDLIFNSAVTAKQAVDNNLVTPSVENIIEANLLLSGIGFESGGLAAAHGVMHGLRSVVSNSHYLHGEYVAFGTLVQLILEHRHQKEIHDMFSLYKSIGLPFKFEHIGLIDPNNSLLRTIAENACEAGTTKNMPFKIDANMMLDSLKLVDKIGQLYSQDSQ